jgi:hypothetical protein
LSSTVSAVIRGIWKSSIRVLEVVGGAGRVGAAAAKVGAYLE